jgi:hypothetical protein
MAMDMQEQERFDRILSANLSRATDFIKFGETKNAALLTFCSAWIVAIISLLFRDSPLPAELIKALSISLPLFGIAAVVSILSFLPKLKLSKLDKTPDRRANLLYFGDIASLNSADFLSVLQARYSANADADTGKYLDDLAVQVTVNSKIALRKFNYFNWGAGFALFAMSVLLLAMCVHLALALWTA